MKFTKHALIRLKERSKFSQAYVVDKFNNKSYSILSYNENISYFLIIDDMGGAYVFVVDTNVNVIITVLYPDYYETLIGIIPLEKYTEARLGKIYENKVTINDTTKISDGKNAYKIKLFKRCNKKIINLISLRMVDKEFTNIIESTDCESFLLKHINEYIDIIEVGDEIMFSRSNMKGKIFSFKLTSYSLNMHQENLLTSKNSH